MDQQHKDLNVDLCFELIFPYLNISDLVNVSNSCKQMKEVAEMIFHQKYGRASHFILDPNGSYKFNDKTLLNSETCFGFLRCFGHMLLILKLNYDHCSSLLSSRLNAYVIKYCTFVNEIEILSNIRRVSMQNVIAFLDSCKSLKKLVFRPQNTTDYKKLIQLLNNRRNISITVDEECPTLKIICYKYETIG